MAAKIKTQTASSHRAKPKRKRPGIHSKNNTSKSKNATNYVKTYNGQGK